MMAARTTIRAAMKNVGKILKKVFLFAAIVFVARMVFMVGQDARGYDPVTGKPHAERSK